ncbi:MAG: M48 family metalloprotease [Bacteroidetes bacterium]|nr:M48 family metalloprotease [Fibrella sp.]
MTVFYARSLNLLAGLLVAMTVYTQTQAQTEVPVLVTKTATIVDYKPSRLRIDVNGDLTDYYSQIDVSDSTLIFASPAEQTAFEGQREKLERDYQRTAGRRQKSTKQSSTVKLPPYLMPFADGRNQLRPDVEISLSFLEYRYSRRFVLQSITILTDLTDDGKLTGPLEQVTGEVAIINGQSVKLKPNTTLAGDKGYKGVSFPGFNRVEEGVNVAVQGTHQPDGILIAEAGTVTPEEASNTDQQLIQTLKATRQLSSDGTRLTFGSVSYPLLANDTINGYLTRLTTKLLPARVKNLPTDHPSYFNTRVYLVVDSTANACIYPDGSLYITTGLLTMVENEAQLAAVLSRELAHITFHHPRRMYQTGSTGETTLPPSMVAVFGLEPAELATYVTTFGGGPLSSDYKQDLERQADRIGIKYMMVGGYDPREMTKVWTRLYKESPDVPLVPFRSRTLNRGGRLWESPYGTHTLAGRRYKYANSLLLVKGFQSIDLNKFSTGESAYKPIREELARLTTPQQPAEETQTQAVVPQVRTRSRSRSESSSAPVRSTRRKGPVTSGPVKKGQ